MALASGAVMGAPRVPAGTLAYYRSGWPEKVVEVVTRTSNSYWMVKYVLGPFQHPFGVPHWNLSLFTEDEAAIWRLTGKLPERLGIG